MASAVIGSSVLIRLFIQVDSVDVRLLHYGRVVVDVVGQQGLRSLASLLPRDPSFDRTIAQERDAPEVIRQEAALACQDLRLHTCSLEELVVAQTVGHWQEHLVLLRESAGVETAEGRVETNRVLHLAPWAASPGSFPIVPAARGVVCTSSRHWVSGQLIKSLKLLLAVFHSEWFPGALPAVLISFLVQWVEDHAFFLVDNRAIKVLAFVLGHVGVVLGEHHREVRLEIKVLHLILEPLRRLGMDWFSHLEEVLNGLVVEGVFPDAAGGRLVDVLQQVFVLLLALPLVEELLVLRVHVVVATAVRHVSAVVPGPLVSFRLVNSFLKPVHCLM